MADFGRGRQAIRVLHVIGSLAPRFGGPSNLMGLTRALVGQGCDVTIYTTDLDGRGSIVPGRPTHRLSVALDRPTVEDGVTLQHFPVQWPSRYIFSIPLWKALHTMVRTFDIVHIHSLYLFHGAAAAHHSRSSHVPYIIRPHGTLDTYHRRRRRLLKGAYTLLIERRNLDRAAAIHYTSEAEARQARDSGVLTPGFVVPLGVDLQPMKEMPSIGEFRAAHPRLGNQRLVVFLGRLTEKKGFDVLIPALAILVKATPNVQLVIAGPDDEGYAREIDRLCASYAVSSHVLRTGLLTGAAKLALLRDADVFVLPSHDESFGIAAIEALAAGAPVILSDRVAIAEQLERKHAGLVVQLDAEALARSIQSLLSAPEFAARMGARGRILVFEHYSWEAAARELAAHYRRVIETAPAANSM